MNFPTSKQVDNVVAILFKYLFQEKRFKKWSIKQLDIAELKGLTLCRH